MRIDNIDRGKSEHRNKIDAIDKVSNNINNYLKLFI